MKKIILVVLLLVTVLFTFARQSKHRKKAQSGNEIISVAMRHTACFGTCPDFIIEINRNGIATYTGLHFTPDSGVYTKKIGVAKAMEIINKFNEYRLDTCLDRYESRIQDLPGLIYTIKYKNKTKEIQNANFGPPVLAKLRVIMDSVPHQKIIGSELQPLDNSWHKATGDRK